MIANIALNDAMILSYDANLGRMEFLEGTGRQCPLMTQSGHTASRSIISSARELDRRGLRVVAMIC
jgi:hypothetical protein